MTKQEMILELAAQSGQIEYAMDMSDETKTVVVIPKSIVEQWRRLNVHILRAIMDSEPEEGLEKVNWNTEDVKTYDDDF